MPIGGIVTKTAVTRLLIAFHIVTIGAVFLRIDTFPLTWVPMYSQYLNKEVLNVPVGDKAKLRKGFEVTTAAGETEYINAKTLNIPNAAMRRIYTERAFGKGPAKHNRERDGLNPVSTAIFNLIREDPLTTVDWDARILDMMNETLGRRQGDPSYIVKAVASYEFTNLVQEPRRKGDLSNLYIERRTVVMTKKTP